MLQNIFKSGFDQVLQGLFKVRQVCSIIIENWYCTVRPIVKERNKILHLTMRLVEG